MQELNHKFDLVFEVIDVFDMTQLFCVQSKLGGSYTVNVTRPTLVWLLHEEYTFKIQLSCLDSAGREHLNDYNKPKYTNPRYTSNMVEIIQR